MIYVDTEKCDGCGLCVDACSHGALKLVNGVIEVDDSLCRETGACMEVCPQGALLEVTDVKQEHPIVRPEAPIMKRQQTSVSKRSLSTRSWLGAALQFLVTDVAPELLSYWREKRQPTRIRQPKVASRKGGGPCGEERKLRRRRRKGWRE